MSWLLLVPCVLVIGVIVDALLAMVTRPWIRLPVFPLLNIKAAREAFRGLSPRVYVVVVGVIGWGWTCFGGITLWEYLRFHYWGLSASRFSVFGVIWGFFVWSAAGIWFGYGSWKRIAR